MILSVSRRTDVPSYYSDWFYNRIREGFLYVRNPMNPRQVSEIQLSPDVVDCIVFWTKNPAPMLGRLHELDDYAYYFQFTLTGYGRDIESNLPDKKKVLIPTFRRLSEQIGRERVIWRYDPIIFNAVYTPEYHRKAFGQIAALLDGYTDQCVISFVDIYAKNKKSMEHLSIEMPDDTFLTEFSGQLSRIAKEHSMEIVSCAEKLDLQPAGIKHSCCIDKELISRILGCEIDVSKDKNQREACGCVESVEVGTYNTCRNGCRYCYANYSGESVAANCRNYNPLSPLLCGEISPEDTIHIRKLRSLKERQLRMW